MEEIEWLFLNFIRRGFGSRMVIMSIVMSVMRVIYLVFWIVNSIVRFLGLNFLKIEMFCIKVLFCLLVRKCFFLWIV